jgi:hypothetical protein
MAAAALEIQAGLIPAHDALQTKLQLTAATMSALINKEIEQAQSTDEIAAAIGRVATSENFLLLGQQFDLINQKIQQQPTLLEQAGMAWEQWGEQSQAVLANASMALLDLTNRFTQDFSQAIARSIVLGEDFGKAMTDMFKNLAIQAIASIIKIALQWIISSLLGLAASTAEHSARMGQLFAQATVGAFAATAAIPVVGPVLAPKAAAGALAAVTALSIGAYTLGSALGKTQVFAEGGIVTSPTLALIGEAGPEAVIPLARGMNGFMGDQNITVMLDNKVLTRSVIKGMPREVRLRVGSSYL